MTLNDAKILLSENNIVFDVREFESETAYWHHVSMFPYTKNAKPCKVIVLSIRSNNGRNDIELQFNANDNNISFEELWFGGYSFEMFDYNEEILVDDLLDRIKEIQSGNFVVIIANDLKNTSASITELTEKHGFTNYKLFLKMFRKTYGCTPIEYKRSNT